jgi:hypothetical protein
MGRRKGERSPSAINRTYPLEIEIPDAGLGTRMDTMDTFCRERSYDYPTRNIGKLRKPRGQDAMRRCFTDDPRGRLLRGKQTQYAHFEFCRS